MRSGLFAKKNITFSRQSIVSFKKITIFASENGRIRWLQAELAQW